MFAWDLSSAFWLNVTNIGLGVITAVFCLLAGRALLKDMAERLHRSGRDG